MFWKGGHAGNRIGPKNGGDRPIFSLAGKLSMQGSDFWSITTLFPPVPPSALPPLTVTSPTPLRDGVPEGRQGQVKGYPARRGH